MSPWVHLGDDEPCIQQPLEASCMIMWQAACCVALGELHGLLYPCTACNVARSCTTCCQSLSPIRYSASHTHACRQMQRDKEVKQAEQALAQSAEVQRITRYMRAAAATKPCAVCGEDICELEGIYCPRKEHFVCDECFAPHVKSQSELADDFVAYDAGEVWCVCKPVPSPGGCGSQRPFTPKVSLVCTILVGMYSRWV